MSHMMRKSAKALLGKHVVVYHVEGWSCHGVLHSMTHEGVYLMNAQMIDHISSPDTQTKLEHAFGPNGSVDATEVFFPFFFLPFAVLTGIAAASAVRPPYYYGGYPGYPGPYGGYGYGPYPGYW